MINKNDFIGMGHNPNPEVPDIPLGLGMALFQTPEARSSFENLSNEDKTRLINYVQSNNSSGIDAKQKIYSAVDNLKNGNTSFF